jgi:hypothetical protein
MRKHLLAAAVAFGAVSLVIACSGSTPKDFKDAAAGAFGAPCVTVTNMSTECDHVTLNGSAVQGACTNSFNQDPTPICSVQCTMTMMTDPTECPVGSDGMAFCNMKGYCKP